MSLHLEAKDNLDKITITASVILETWDRDTNELDTAWTPAVLFRLVVVSVLMLLTLLSNAIVIITIVSCAELRKKRVNIFILNLAVGDLMVCFVSMQ